jgi:high affinity Mn2+ porin
MNQLSGTRPMKRYSITVGRFTVTDFLDNNRYSHDPRMPFMGWSAMYNGACDYPADTAATHLGMGTPVPHA